MWVHCVWDKYRETDRETKRDRETKWYRHTDREISGRHAYVNVLVVFI